MPRGLGDADRVYLRPLLSIGEPEFRHCEILVRGHENAVTVARMTIESAMRWAQSEGDHHADRVAQLLARCRAPRPAVAGLAFDRPRIMGVVNVTPDSFSDGGDHIRPEAAIAHGRALAAAGADIVDVGGESTRPGAEPTPAAVERARVLPVIEGLAGAGLAVSVDTRKAEIMAAALDAGATIINDVSGLTHDPESISVVAAAAAPVVLMHAGGDPTTMQHKPRYGDVLLDVFDYLETRLVACDRAGIGRDRVIVDPGFGFGKTLEHNLALLRGLSLFRALGCPIMIGASRKSFIGRLGGVAEPKRRLAGSLAWALRALAEGADVVRTHDAAATAEAIAVWQATADPKQKPATANRLLCGEAKIL